MGQLAHDEKAGADRTCSGCLGNQSGSQDPTRKPEVCTAPSQNVSHQGTLMKVVFPGVFRMSLKTEEQQSYIWWY